MPQRRQLIEARVATSRRAAASPASTIEAGVGGRPFVQSKTAPAARRRYRSPRSAGHAYALERVLDGGEAQQDGRHARPGRSGQPAPKPASNATVARNDTEPAHDGHRRGPNREGFSQGRSARASARAAHAADTSTGTARSAIGHATDQRRGEAPAERKLLLGNPGPTSGSIHQRRAIAPAGWSTGGTR
jgi:hypothetical protein